MAVVRDHLADIETLRAEGARWGDIAAAMAAQGVTQGDGEPISERRLTALIASVRKQQVKRASTQNKRLVRSDVERQTVKAADVSASSSKIVLSPELTLGTKPGAQPGSSDAEDTLRRDRLDQVRALFRSDSDRLEKDTKP